MKAEEMEAIEAMEIMEPVAEVTKQVEKFKIKKE